MFADWELIGVPYRVVVGERSLKEGLIEFQGRSDSAAQNLAPSELLQTLKDCIAQQSKDIT
jgi:prolyl-tRNA synthetase